MVSVYPESNPLKLRNKMRFLKKKNLIADKRI